MALRQIPSKSRARIFKDVISYMRLTLTDPRTCKQARCKLVLLRWPPIDLRWPPTACNLLAMASNPRAIVSNPLAKLCEPFLFESQVEHTVSEQPSLLQFFVIKVLGFRTPSSFAYRSYFCDRSSNLSANRCVCSFTCPWIQ